MAYELAPLPYDYAALEPFIDAETVKIHHDKHHQTYVNNLNAALANYPELAAKPVDDLLRDLAKVPEGIRTAVRNHGGGHANHSLFWSLMGPVGSDGIGGDPRAPSPPRLPPTSAASRPSRRPSTRPPPSSSVPAGAGSSSRRASSSDLHAQPGIAALPGPLSRPAQRRLGARLLPQVPEPPPRLSWPPGGMSSTGTKSIAASPSPRADCVAFPAVCSRARSSLSKEPSFGTWQLRGTRASPLRFAENSPGWRTITEKKDGERAASAVSFLRRAAIVRWFFIFACETVEY
jgi:hypothetical protein